MEGWISIGDLGGGNSTNFLLSPQTLGEMIQFDLLIFFKWMVQPPTRDDVYYVPDTWEMDFFCTL